jgi:predicted MFS family arabinose efflux permease
MWSWLPKAVYVSDRYTALAEFRPLVAAVLAVIAGALPIFLTASLAGQIDHSFAFSQAVLGLTVATFHLVGVVLSPTISRVLPRFGIQSTLRLSGVIAASATLCIATFVSSAPLLLCALVVAGLSNGAVGPTASALLRQTVPVHRHGLAFGTQQAGGPAAIFLAGLAVPLVAVPFGWRWAFAGACVVALLAALVAPPLPRERRQATRRLPSEFPRRRPTPRVSRTADRSRAVLYLIVIAAVGGSAVGVSVLTFLVVFATRAGISQAAAGLLLGAVSLAGMIGRIVFGLRVDRGRGQPLSTALPLLFACSVGVTFLIVGTPLAIVTGALILGGLGWAWHGVLTLAIVRQNDDAPVWAVGMLMSGVFAGAIVGPLLVGAVSAQTSFRTAWTMCALLSLVPLGAVALARRRTSAAVPTRSYALSATDR